MGRKFIVEYERQGCIGAGVCAAVDDKHWVMNADGKADLIQGEKHDNPGNAIWVREIDESELEVVKAAAEGCPVLVIHIIDKETKQKII